MRAFPLITNFNEKNAYSKSQISNIVLVEYFILLEKKNLLCGLPTDQLPCKNKIK